MAQNQYTVKFTVSTPTTESLQGTILHLEHINYALIYRQPLSEQGSCTLHNVVEGIHYVKIEKEYLAAYENNNLDIRSDTTIQITLQEQTRTPYALESTIEYNPSNGQATAHLSWNQEKSYFFDDFESYDPFSINFAPWSGIDVDQQQAAMLSGSYPNRGLRQYATIFNALTIDPPVWFDYPVLRPASGKQYVGFIRTASGEANNDWLISAQIKVGVKNILRFLAKAGDAPKERFAVHISTTGTEIKDFKKLTDGNYQEVDYQGWKSIEYQLGAYEGKEVYIAIQCLSKAAFMLMIDDLYVGPANITPTRSKRTMRSPDNPYERFVIYCDNDSIDTTESLSYSLEGITEGTHTIAIQALYRTSESQRAEIEVEVAGASSFAAIELRVSANGGNTDNLTASFLNINTGTPYSATITQGKATLPYLAKGKYLIGIESPLFDTYNEIIELTEDAVIAVALKERIVKPINLTADITSGQIDNTHNVTLKWNQDLGWNDGFEEYTTFAQQFGKWTTYDLDSQKGYGIQLDGSNLQFPGAGQAGSGIIFDAAQTTPNASADGMLCAPTGNQYVMFISPERYQANDWLISEKMRIREGYVARVWAKSYDASFSESFLFGVCESTETQSFTSIAKITSTNTWTEYEIDLSDFAGDSLHIAINYISQDKFIFQLDNIYVGPAVETPLSNIGAKSYDLYLNQQKVGNTKDFHYTYKDLPYGSYILGVSSIYDSGSSEIVTYELTTSDNKELQLATLASILSSGKQISILLNSGINGSVIITNMMGQQVYQQHWVDSSCNIAIAQSGIYLVTLIVDGKIVTQKVAVD